VGRSSLCLVGLIIPVVPDGVKRKLARAGGQVKTINEKIEAYAADHANPMTLAGDLDGLVFTLQMPKVPPLDPNLSVDIGQVLHNLRSALDQTTYAMLQANIPHVSGLTSKQRDAMERASQFPITDNPQKFSDATPMVQGLSADAVATIERFQPFNNPKGVVGDSLWCVRELSNTDKHRLVHPVWSVLSEAHVEMRTYPLAIPHNQVWNSGALPPEGVLVKVFFRHPPGEAHVRTHGGVAVALHSGMTLLGSVQPVLENLYQRTKETVDAMAMHCNAA
jgi:hypothetical protein